MFGSRAVSDWLLYYKCVYVVLCCVCANARVHEMQIARTRGSHKRLTNCRQYCIPPSDKHTGTRARALFGALALMHQHTHQRTHVRTHMLMVHTDEQQLPRDWLHVCVHTATHTNTYASHTGCVRAHVIIRMQ